MPPGPGPQGPVNKGGPIPPVGKKQFPPHDWSPHVRQSGHGFLRGAESLFAAWKVVRSSHRKL